MKIQSKPNRREIALGLSALENREPKALKALAKVFSSKDSLKRSICFTGPAGVGKSTLISNLISLAALDRTIAWLAFDPSSQKTGGSLLGDRIRLSGQNISENIFIRSMSTRSTSAFSLCVRDVEIYLENHFDEVWVETAGTGQTQSEVANISALTVLILQPETGDEIQWMKSGVREWADLFIVHKADLGGAETMIQSLKEQGAAEDRILAVSSRSKKGFDEVLAKIRDLQKSQDWKARQKSLHLEHSRALFFEREMKALNEKFKLKQSRFLLKPYL